MRATFWSSVILDLEQKWKCWVGGAAYKDPLKGLIRKSVSLREVHGFFLSSLAERVPIFVLKGHVSGGIDFKSVSSSRGPVNPIKIYRNARTSRKLTTILWFFEKQICAKWFQIRILLSWNRGPDQNPPNGENHMRFDKILWNLEFVFKIIDLFRKSSRSSN